MFSNLLAIHLALVAADPLAPISKQSFSAASQMPVDNHRAPVTTSYAPMAVGATPTTAYFAPAPTTDCVPATAMYVPVTAAHTPVASLNGQAVPPNYWTNVLRPVVAQPSVPAQVPAAHYQVRRPIFPRLWGSDPATTTAIPVPYVTAKQWVHLQPVVPAVPFAPTTTFYAPATIQLAPQAFSSPACPGYAPSPAPITTGYGTVGTPH